MLHECPVCQWKPIKGDECPQCKTSLAPLLRVLALPQTYLEQGLRQLDAGQLDEAIASLAAAAAHDHAQRAAACAALGRAYAKKGWHREAVAQFDAALALAPTDEETRQARDAASRALTAREQEDSQREASLLRARRWAYLAPVAFLFGLALVPAGQRIFRSPGSAQERTLAVARAVEQELGAAPAGRVVVSAGEDGGIRLAGAVPAELRERVLRAAAEQAGGADVDAAALATLAPPPPPAALTYRVRSGDSLWRIARRIYGRSQHWKLLYEHNRERLPDPRRLTPGQELLLPPNPEAARR
jgi:nucleoid-associated protein YgaU